MKRKLAAFAAQSTDTVGEKADPASVYSDAAVARGIIYPVIDTANSAFFSTYYVQVAAGTTKQSDNTYAVVNIDGMSLSYATTIYGTVTINGVKKTGSGVIKNGTCNFSVTGFSNTAPGKVVTLELRTDKGSVIDTSRIRVTLF